MLSVQRKCWLHLNVGYSEKREKIIESCKSFLKTDSFPIRELSSLIGTLTSTFPGNNLGPLYYRELDKCKTLGLKKAKGNSDTSIKLTKEATLDLQWWIKNLYTMSKNLQYPDIIKVFYTDASMHGWGHTVKKCQQEDHGLTQKRIAI